MIDCMEGFVCRGSARFRSARKEVGLPVDLATRKRVGLGMRLIHALVQQTEAKLRIERPERGNKFVLDISLKDEELISNGLKSTWNQSSGAPLGSGDCAPREGVLTQVSGKRTQQHPRHADLPRSASPLRQLALACDKFTL